MRVNSWLHKLTPKQLNFCLNYLDGMSAKQAMIKAGYSELYAHKLSSNILKSRIIAGFLREELERKAQESAYLSINLEAEVARRALEESDPELQAEYMKEARQWIKQRKDIELKLKEIEARLDAADNRNENPITINFGIAKEDARN